MWVRVLPCYFWLGIPLTKPVKREFIVWGDLSLIISGNIVASMKIGTRGVWLKVRIAHV